MRRLLGAVALCCAAAAHGQGITSPGSGIGPAGPGIGPAGLTSAVVAKWTFDRTGVPIPWRIGGIGSDPALHLIWDGTALVERQPVSVGVLMQGVVPQVATGPWYPGGFAGSPKPGAGPFETTKYYKMPAADSVFDTTGDFIVCAVLDGNPVTGAAQRIVSDKVADTSGFDMSFTATGTLASNFRSPVAVGDATATVGVNGINIACLGRATTTAWVKLNLGTAKTTALPAQVASTATVGRIGADAADGSLPLTMTLRELIFWRGETPTDAKLIAIQKHVFGMYGSRGVDAQPLTFTRATTASCPLPYEGQTSYLVPAAVPCINGGSNGTNGGLRVEPLRINYALNSATHPKTAEATASLPTGSYVAWHLGAGTSTIATGAATTTGLPCTTQAAAAICSFAVTVAGAIAITTSDAGATHIQVEGGLYRTSMIATAATSVQRNADAPTVTTPQPLNGWCLTSTLTPEYARALNGASAKAWGWGAAGNNSAAAVFGTASFVLTQTDNAAGAKTYTTTSADSSTTGGTYTGCMTGGVAGWFKTGAKVAGAAAGAGTGTWTGPTTLYLGAGSAAGGELGGYLRNVKICPRSGKVGLCK